MATLPAPAGAADTPPPPCPLPPAPGLLVSPAHRGWQGPGTFHWAGRRHRKASGTWQAFRVSEAPFCPLLAVWGRTPYLTSVLGPLSCVMGSWRLTAAVGSAWQDNQLMAGLQHEERPPLAPSQVTPLCTALCDPLCCHPGWGRGGGWWQAAPDSVAMVLGLGAHGSLGCGTRERGCQACFRGDPHP